MTIVDFHSHWFSRPFFEALAGLSPQGGTVEDKLEEVSAKTGIELPPVDNDQHLARWKQSLDQHGVDHLVAFSSHPAETGTVGEAAARSDGRITPMALVDPTQPGTPAKVEALVRDHGFAGVLVFPAMHHFDPAGPELDGVLEALEPHGGIIYVHCGMLVVKLRDLLGIPRPYDMRHADPLRVVPAANRHRNVRFVIPHFGAGFLRETLMLGAQCENTYVDTSSSNSWISSQPGLGGLAEVFSLALEVFGPERILFGTDSNVFPAGWRADRLAEQRACLESLRQGPEVQSRIFGGNALELLGKA